MAGPTLPAELLTSVFNNLSPSSLATASRVCRNWRTLTFPLLHETIYLCLASHLEQFVHRIHAENVKSQFSITAHLKALVFDVEYMEDREREMIQQSDLESLNVIIPRLINLKYLSWNLMFAPQTPETFRLFQTECPNLDSVHIWLNEGIDYYSDQYEMLFEFKNLSYFSLSIWDMLPGFDDHQLDPLASLLARCSNLSSIILYLQGEFPYSPSALVTAVGDECVFPRLWRFHAQGKEDPGWTEFFNHPESHSLRQFFIRHPRIEDLALGYTHESLHYGDIDPAEIAHLFPSVRYFEGPVFLVRPLVLSALTEQIEKLIIVDEWLRDEVSLTEIYDQIPKLPRLRKFGIWAELVEDDILVNMLRTIVNAAGHLEEIELHPEIDSDSYGEVMDLITQVHGLRSVTLNESILAVAAEKEGEDELGWDAFALILRDKCPRLRTIYRPITKFDKENRGKVWELLEGA